MKLTAVFAILSTLIAASASRTPATLHAQDIRDIRPKRVERTGLSYPKTATAGFKARRGGMETNGERIRRGLKINSRPRKVYQARKYQAPEGGHMAIKRLSDSPAVAAAPPQISITPSGNIYDFLGCYTTVGGTGEGYETFAIPYENTIQLANDCAAKQDQAAKLIDSYGSFHLADPQAGYGFTCAVSVSPSGNSVACTTSSLPFYRLRETEGPGV